MYASACQSHSTRHYLHHHYWASSWGLSSLSYLRMTMISPASEHTENNGSLRSEFANLFNSCDSLHCSMANLHFGFLFPSKERQERDKKCFRLCLSFSQKNLPLPSIHLSILKTSPFFLYLLSSPQLTLLLSHWVTLIHIIMIGLEEKKLYLFVPIVAHIHWGALSLIQIHVHVCVHYYFSDSFSLFSRCANSANTNKRSERIDHR